MLQDPVTANRANKHEGRDRRASYFCSKYEKRGMLSFNFSTLLVFLLPYVPSAIIAKNACRGDPVPCKNFYDKGDFCVFNGEGSGSTSHHKAWRGGTDCWCPPYEGEDIEKYGNNYYWCYSGKRLGLGINTHDGYYRWMQAEEPLAQNWANCDYTALDVERPNLEWAVKHCDGIPKESGVNGWGNSYDIPS